MKVIDLPFIPLAAHAPDRAMNARGTA